jgi:hypothetical protein
LLDRTVDPLFAQRMRELLHERGVSYRALGARTYYAKSYLHSLAAGQRLPTVEVARRIDDALHAGGELAAMVTANARRRTRRVEIDTTPAVGEDGHVLRRTVIAAVAGLGLGHLVDQVAVSALLAGIGGRQPDQRTVDDWHETVWEYGHLYLSTPRAELLADLTADLATVVALTSRTSSDSIVAGLNEAGARLAGLLAMVCTDLGYMREARHSWRAARRLADESGSTGTRLWTRGQEAVLGLYSRRPLPLVLELVDRGLAIDDHTATGGLVHLYSAKAQTLALLGQADQAVGALHDVEDEFNRLPASTTTTTYTVFGWPEHRLHHTASFVHGVAGRTTDAIAAQDRALALYSPKQAIGRSQVQMHRAACMVRDGDIDHGMTHAAATLTGLPAYARGNFVLTVADTVLATVPGRERTRPEVAQYKELLGMVRAGDKAVGADG